MTTPEDRRWQDPSDLGETRWIPPEDTEQTTVWQQPQPSWEEQQRAVPPDHRLEPVGKHVLIAFVIVAVVAAASIGAFFLVRHNGSQQAAPPRSNPPVVTSTTTEPSTTTGPTTATTTTTTTSTTAGDPRKALTEAPLSAATATMSPATCALPRFDLPDAKQAQFFKAAKTCADDAWNATLSTAGVQTGTVKLVVVQGSAVQTSCGEVGPADPPTQCQGTVYMTPAYLRDVQGNGRYPGRYFGALLREYGHALQDTSGVAALYKSAKSQPGADPDELDRRYQDQAICLAGIASGAMAGHGAVDGNITHEIRERVTTGDPAPSDAGSWLDKGFGSRQLSSCNTWAG